MERERELPHEPLTEGLYRDEPLELRYKSLDRPSASGVDSLLDDDRPLLLEPSDSSSREGLRRHAGERFAAPCRAPRPQVVPARASPSPRADAPPPPDARPAESSCSRWTVSTYPCPSRRSRSGRRPSAAEDESVERVGCGWRRRLSPETDHQPVPGNHRSHRGAAGRAGTLFRPAEALLPPPLTTPTEPRRRNSTERANHLCDPIARAPRRRLPGSVPRERGGGECTSSWS